MDILKKLFFPGLLGYNLPSPQSKKELDGKRIKHPWLWTRKHSHERENDRRRRQIRYGILREENGLLLGTRNLSARTR